jgi:hypothetical protein
MRADDMAEVLSAALPRILNIAEAEKRRGGFIKMIDRQGAHTASPPLNLASALLVD